MNDFAFGSPLGVNRDGSVAFAGQTDRAYVEFFPQAVKHGAKSLEAGSPQFVQKDFVKVIFPGEKDCVIREVKDQDKFRWPAQWNAYVQGKVQAPDGTPLALLFPQNPEIVETLRALKFHVVEQLAGAADTALQSIGLGGREWQQKAQKFLDHAQKGVGFHQVEKQLKEKDEKIDQLTKLVNDLNNRLTELESDDYEPAPRRRGRPPKAAE